MTIEAKIIADSYGPHSKRLTTFQLKYPRFIHAELMTHRMFSRNASSSRAVPVKRMIEDVLTDPAMPIHWGKNQPGMQAKEENDTPVIIDTFFDSDGVWDKHGFAYDSEQAWLFARDRAVEVAKAFDAAGYHKQVVNRILEPYMHISVVVTATNFDNFFWLRRHPDAQPEIKALADAMFEVYRWSTPQMLHPGEWHVPYVTPEEKGLLIGGKLSWEDLIKFSVARCARVSYLTHDGKEPSREQDAALYDRLVGSAPLHASPAEHQATPDQQLWGTYDQVVWESAHLSGNFDEGWVQYRKTLPGEVCTEYRA